MHDSMRYAAIHLKLQSNFWRTHVMNFIANLLAVKFIILFGTGASLDGSQRRNAGRHGRNRISHESFNSKRKE